MLITVNVTQKHIDKGCKGDGTNCPVYHAIMDQVKLQANLMLHVSCTKVFSYDRENMVSEPGGNSFEVALPPIVGMHILGFDAGKGMRPFSFDIEIPDCFLATKKPLVNKALLFPDLPVMVGV